MTLNTELIDWLKLQPEYRQMLYIQILEGDNSHIIAGVYYKDDSGNAKEQVVEVKINNLQIQKEVWMEWIMDKA